MLKIQGEHRFKDFFEIAANAIENEDRAIQASLQPFPAYANWEHGASILYETTIAYIIVRSLWTAGFRYVVWNEVTYPGSRADKLDLAVYESSPQNAPPSPAVPLLAAVEVKLTVGDVRSQQEIWRDICKLVRFATARDRYLFLASFGLKHSDLGSHVAALLAGHLGVRQFSIDEVINRVLSGFPDRLSYCREHFAKATEVLWTEFDTDVRPDFDQIRLSLIEVALR